MILDELTRYSFMLFDAFEQVFGGLYLIKLAGSALSYLREHQGKDALVAIWP